ncbi:MAG: EamA family transporter, partial [Myxococcota bacterium]
MVGLLLGVLSAILWVALDAMRKDISEDVPPSGLLVGLHWPQLPLLLLLLVWGSWRPGTGAPDDPWTLMVGSGGVPAQALEWSYLAPASVALIFALVANLLFLRAVQLSPLSLTIPYLSFTPIFSAIGAFIIDGEAPTPWGWLGIAIVSGGAFLLNPGDRDQGLMAPLKAIWTERGSLYMLGVAFCWSVTAVVDSRAAGVTSATWHTLMLTLGNLVSVV